VGALVYFDFCSLVLKWIFSVGDLFSLYSLPDIIEEIAKEDEERQKRHLRRMVSEQERLKSRPPRLGKYKYASSLDKDVVFSILLFTFCMIYCQFVSS